MPWIGIVSYPSYNPPATDAHIEQNSPSGKIYIEPLAYGARTVCLQEDAQKLADEICAQVSTADVPVTAEVVEDTLGPGAQKYVYPDFDSGEDLRKVYNIRLSSGQGDYAGTLLAERFARGIGHPGKWTILPNGVLIFVNDADPRPYFVNPSPTTSVWPLSTR